MFARGGSNIRKHHTKLFLKFEWIFLYFNVCLLSCHWEESGLVFTSSHQIFTYTKKTPPPLSLLFPRLSKPICLSLSSYVMLQALNHLSGPSLDLLQYLLVQNWTSSTPDMSPHGWVEVINHLPWRWWWSSSNPECWPSLPQRHTAGSCSPWCPPVPRSFSADPLAKPTCYSILPKGYR